MEAEEGVTADLFSNPFSSIAVLSGLLCFKGAWLGAEQED